MENKLYNPEIKEQFLAEYAEDTQTTYKYMFYKSYTTELMLDKDVYAMDIDELKKVLYNANPLTLAASRANKTVLSTYINWAIEKGLVASNINPLKVVTAEWTDQFVDRSKMLFISENKLEELEKKCVNAQDAVILRLLFEGVGGPGGSEILNLTSGDMDWENNSLKLKQETSSGEMIERTLTVSDKCIHLIEAALQESHYHKKNGESTARNPVVKLVENEYVVRNAGTRVTNFDRADKHIIYRRLSVLSEYFGLPYLTSKNVERSGMLKMARDLYLRDGVLQTPQLKEIAERFGIQKIKMGNYQVYNFAVLRDFITLEHIKELYEVKSVPYGDEI